MPAVPRLQAIRAEIEYLSRINRARRDMVQRRSLVQSGNALLYHYDGCCIHEIGLGQQNAIGHCHLAARLLLPIQLTRTWIASAVITMPSSWQA